MKLLQPAILLLSFSFLAFRSSAQLIPITEKDEGIILSAAWDELNRNMEQLGGKDMQKPFFMAYTMVWGEEFNCSAQLGSIYECRTTPLREATMRLMVGDYALNDENYNDPQQYNSTTSGLSRFMTIPEDADYWAIRRHFWQVSNEVFRSANLHYKHKLEAIRKKGGIYQPSGIPDYVKGTQVKDLSPAISLKLNPDSISRMLSRVSSFFRNDTMIIDSRVSYAAGTTVSYYINSEGTELHAPHTYASIRIYTQGYDKHGASISEGITFDGIELNGLPSEPELLKACALVKERLEAQGEVDTIPENYTGPMLFEGESAVDFFRNYFFTGKNTLVASREDFQDETTREIPKQNENDDQKYNKKIFSKDLTVEDCPNLKEYNGVKLLGCYTIDAEGIKPKDNFLLVENGVLRNMLNNRIPTPGQSEPNGHCRFYSTQPTTEVLPSVLKITTNEGKSIDELKKALIQEASERGLEYAIVLKPCFIGKFNCGNQYYRLNVADGKEELIHSGIYSSDRFNNGKKERILGLSEGVIVKNDFYTGSNSPILSYIAPDGVLIESAEYSFSQGNDKTITQQYVPFPPINTKD